MVFPSVPESSSYLPSVLFSFRAFLALRWTMPRSIFGEVALQSGFTWWLSLPMWGRDVDGLAYPLHQPTAHSCQARGQGLSAKHYPVLSLQYAVAPFEGCETFQV
jgi:hypothetical protein